MKDVRARLGVRLRDWRRVRRLTQEQLAERAGLSYKFIGEIERGRGNPTIDTLGRLAGALDLDVVDLLGTTDPQQPGRAVYGAMTRDLQMAREALESLGDVIENLEGGAYPKRRRRP